MGGEESIFDIGLSFGWRKPVSKGSNHTGQSDILRIRFLRFHGEIAEKAIDLLCYSRGVGRWSLSARCLFRYGARSLPTRGRLRCAQDRSERFWKFLCGTTKERLFVPRRRGERVIERVLGILPQTSWRHDSQIHNRARVLFLQKSPREYLSGRVPHRLQIVHKSDP